tara:strand:+ start:46227 stop:48239 length:2013 start_codon:yes stop_codon:yes gene_type:complete
MTLGSRNRKLKTFTTRGTLAIAAIATTALAGLGGTAYLATDGFNSDDAPVATAEAPETAQNENCVEIQLNDGSVICIDPTLDTPLETIPTTEETTEVAAASAEAAEAALVEEDDTAEEGLTAEDLAETNDETEATDTVATVDLDDTSWQRDPLWKIKDEAVELFWDGQREAAIARYEYAAAHGYQQAIDDLAWLSERGLYQREAETPASAAPTTTTETAESETVLPATEGASDAFTQAFGTADVTPEATIGGRAVHAQEPIATETTPSAATEVSGETFNHRTTPQDALAAFATGSVIADAESSRSLSYNDQLADWAVGYTQFLARNDIPLENSVYAEDYNRAMQMPGMATYVAEKCAWLEQCESFKRWALSEEGLVELASGNISPSVQRSLDNIATGAPDIFYEILARVEENATVELESALVETSVSDNTLDETGDTELPINLLDGTETFAVEETISEEIAVATTAPLDLLEGIDMSVPEEEMATPTYTPDLPEASDLGHLEDYALAIESFEYEPLTFAVAPEDIQIEMVDLTQRISCVEGEEALNIQRTNSVPWTCTDEWGNAVDIQQAVFMGDELSFTNPELNYTANYRVAVNNMTFGDYFRTVIRSDYRVAVADYRAQLAQGPDTQNVTYLSAEVVQDTPVEDETANDNDEIVIASAAGGPETPALN